MGFAKGIEERLEGLVEGFFTKVFRSGLQPIEVGRRMLREMSENKTVSVNRVYAPNDFSVRMGTDDYQRFHQMEAGLQREFSELVIEQAKQNRWNLMGLPRVTFVEEEGMGRGEFKVDAALSADEDVGAPSVSTRQSESEGPQPKAVPSATAERSGMVAAAELIVLDEGGKAKERISITRDPVVIGRMSNSDIVLSDSNVSRRHAELRRDGSNWVLVDLGSTNGTLVNGKLAREQALSDGDKLTFGTSELMFRTRSQGKGG